jgi:hypothetical protein
MSPGRNSATTMTAALRAVTIAAAALVLMLASVGSARALNFNCVNSSLYRNLLRIFNDDPAVFFSYFGVEHRRMPLLDKCRAMMVTGTAQPGDAATLTDHIIASEGWLAVLYLAFESSNLDEELKLAHVVRTFSLSTRSVSGEPFGYEVDFATAWAPLPASGNAAQPAQDASVIDPGMRTFKPRSVLMRTGKPCLDGCMLVWAAGVNRQTAMAWRDAKPYSGEEPADEHLGRMRRGFLYFLDTRRVPVPTGPSLKKPLTPEAWPVLATEAGRQLQAACQAELGVSSNLEGRAAGVFGNFAKDKFTSVDIEPLLTAYGALRRAGARQQKCLAAATESARLAAYDQQCGAKCDKAKVTATMDADLKDFAQKTAKY